MIIRFRYEKEMKEERLKMLRGEYIDIDKYFYNPANLNESERRKIWVHLPFERNSRKWESFGSRSSYSLNTAYMTLCIKSIIDCCSEKYDIIIFDDTSIYEILKDINVDFNKISGPLLEKYREICLMKILYQYGGILIPPSLFMKTSIVQIDDPDIWYVIDSYNFQSASTRKILPTTILSGSNANNRHLKRYIEYLEKIVLQDFGESSIHYSANYFNYNKIPVMDSAMIGITDKKGEPITLERLMSNQEIELHPYAIGLYMPHNELLHRKIYQWYCYLNEREVLDAHCAFSYYMKDGLM
jgi:hypothetical protein